MAECLPCVPDCGLIPSVGKRGEGVREKNFSRRPPHLFKKLYSFHCVCVCPLVWWSEGNLWESVFSFYPVGSDD